MEFIFKWFLIMKLSSFLVNLLFVRVITHELCRPRKIHAEVLTQGCGKKTVSSFDCKGYCISTAKPRFGVKGFAETCTCCKPIRTRVKRVVLCNSFPATMSVATMCTCRTC